MSDLLTLDSVLRATGYVTPEGVEAPGLRRPREVPADRGEPDAIWRDRSGVEVHFRYSESAPDAFEVFESRKRAWNTGFAALLWLVSPDRIDVYDAYARPRGREADEAYLLRTFGAVEQELARLDAYAGRLAFETGRFWAMENRVRSDERVDTQLLGDLGRLERRLVRNGLQRAYAQALIGRTLFLCYLRDRRIAGPEAHEAFAENRLVTWLSDKDRAYDLFDWLRRTFNGDLFPMTTGERKAVTGRQISLVAETFAGVDPEKGQGSLWPYRFDVLPVELISSIYEQFVHASEGREARRTGVHYTPVSVVNLTLDKVLADADPSSRVLDLTCGSGVFLVEALRRLVARNAGEMPQTRELVRRILHSQVFGVDRSDGAIRVAAFSLYLAALELDPDPRPPEALRFEPLIGSSLFVADALGELPEPIRSGSFDVMVGNPPWTYAGGQNVPDWLTNRPLPPRTSDFAFVWRAIGLGQERARIGFVMRATPFFSRAKSSRRACAALLEAMAPASIIDLSALRDDLFPTADYPAVIASGRLPQQPDPSSVPVIKVPWTPAFAKSGTFEVGPEDIRAMPLTAFAADYPSLKVVAFGSGRDRMLLRRLSKDCQTLEEVLNSLGTGLATGIQPLLGDANDASQLMGLPLLEAGSLAPLVDVSALPRFELKQVHRPRSRNIFRAPLVLIGEGPSGGRLAVGLSDSDLVYTESFYGIPLNGAAWEVALVLAGVLASSLPAWYILLTASEFAVHKRKLLRQDLLDLPVPRGDWLVIPAARRVAAAFEAICERDGEVSRRALDEAAFDLFGLSDQERIVVRDGAARAAQEYTEQRTSAEQAPSRVELHAYAEAFLGVVNPWQRLDARSELAAEVMRMPADSPLHVVRFLPDAAAAVRDTALGTSLNEVLSNLGRRLHVSISDSLRVARQLRIYVGEEVFIVKPSARRYWTAGAGLDDADKCLGDALDAGWEPERAQDTATALERR